ncbi:hypothetical protein NDU88_007312 [Pleurodeles waltl]|uniref:Uncharacterized protein n=1 Tax=Pleurodeles waltl TaxID=8319 RepID=A0AAV7PLG6_PLEWA|nr:hypothetical protein NDU88_007312 [Pleurodeles waltl]
MYRPQYYERPIRYLFWGGTNANKNTAETGLGRENTHLYTFHEEPGRHGARTPNTPCDSIPAPLTGAQKTSATTTRLPLWWTDPPRRGESCRSVFPLKERQQALLAANRAFGVFGRCWGPGGTRRSQIGPEERGDVEQDKEPSLKQVAPGEVPETGTTRMCETVLAEVAQRSPTSPETNLESRAMQVRVPWTQAWLCTKDFRRKCTGAGVAAKSRFPAMQPSEVRQGLTSTKLGLKSH